MATGTPTPNLGLNNWVGTDKVLRTEMNSNFTTIDTWAGTVKGATLPYGTDTSASANTITVNLANPPSSYVDGYSVKVKVANTTTGAATLNVNGLGAIAVKNADGSAIGNGDLVAGVPRIFTYVASSPAAFIASGSGGLSGSGNATAADVLAPNTFTSSSGRNQTGTMPNNGTLNYGPSVSSQSIPAGYTPGGTISSVGGTATDANVLTGKTYSSAAGINRTGTMTNRAGTPQSSTSHSTSGTTVSVVAPQGYYDGNTAVTVSDSNLVGGNIKPGVTILGVPSTMSNIAGGNTVIPTTSNQTVVSAGNYVTNAITVAGDGNLQAANILAGRMIFGVAGTVGRASGTVTSNNSTMIFTSNTGATPTYLQIVVSGLSFKPTLILAANLASTANILDWVIYNGSAGFGYGSPIANIYVPQDTTWIQPTGNANITNTGFSLPVKSGLTTYTWWAM